MARKTITHDIDDLDGSASDETVTFGLDGISYEIDLNTTNAEKLRTTLAPYTAAGRRIPDGQPQTKRRPTPQDEIKKIRTWARENGHTISDHGRLPKTITTAYAAAH